MTRKFSTALFSLLGITLFSAAIWAIRTELHGHSLRGITDTALQMPAERLFFATLLVITCYTLLTGYDCLALRFLGMHIRYRRIAAASFIGFAFSNNIGLMPLIGGSVRFRFFAKKGLTGLQLVQLMTFNTTTYLLGFLMLGGVVFTLASPAVPASLGLSIRTLEPLGFLFLGMIGVFLLLSFKSDMRISLYGRTLRLPPFPFAVKQIILSSTEILCAAGILFLLLPSSPYLSFAQLLGIYMLAHIAGMVSQVPGGLGIFESILLALLPEDIDKSAALGSLLLFRLLYYIGPLIVATLALALCEGIEKRHSLRCMLPVLGYCSHMAHDWVERNKENAGGFILLNKPKSSHRMTDCQPVSVSERPRFRLQR